MASTKEVSVPWYKRLFTKPSHLMTVGKALAGGSEQIQVNFYFTDADDIAGNIEKAFAAIDARGKIVEDRMKAVEAEMLAKANAKDKK